MHFRNRNPCVHLIAAGSNLGYPRDGHHASIVDSGDACELAQGGGSGVLGCGGHTGEARVQATSLACTVEPSVQRSAVCMYRFVRLCQCKTPCRSAMSLMLLTSPLCLVWSSPPSRPSARYRLNVCPRQRGHPSTLTAAQQTQHTALPPSVSPPSPVPSSQRLGRLRPHHLDCNT